MTVQFKCLASIHQKETYSNYVELFKS